MKVGEKDKKGEILVMLRRVKEGERGQKWVGTCCQMKGKLMRERIREC